MQFKTGKVMPRLARTWPLLKFIRQRPLLVLVWPAIALLAGALWWWHTLAGLAEQGRRAETDARHQLAAYAEYYATSSQRAIAEVDRVLRLLRRDWRLSEGRTRLEGTAESGIFSSEFVATAAIIDRDGKVLTSSLPPELTMANLADRPYFIAHKRARQDRLLIDSLAKGKLSGREVILLSRPIDRGGGPFDGVVVVSVLPEFFTRNYSAEILGRHGFLGLAGADGVIRAVRAGSLSVPVNLPQRDKLVRAPLPRAAAGTTVLLDGARWFTDGRSRYVGWYPVKGSGLTAVVGVEADEALAGYLRVRKETLAATWWNSAWLVLATFLTSSFYVLARWKKHQLETIRATYRLATEDAGDGFFINRVVRGRHGQIEDVIVVDCNQHGAAQFGLQRDQLVGRRLSEFYRGTAFERVLARLREALDKGVYEREIRVGSDRLMKATWIHYKAVRGDDDDLAVTIRDISESKAHLQELERRSNEDELTGLPNRYWIHQYLPRAIEDARAAGVQLALLFIDLDGFKKVNDALGHACGDQLLRTVAKRLTIAVRPHDHVVRLGGDEFVVLLEHIERRMDVELVAARVLGVFRDGFHLQQATHMLGASIGISLYPEHGEDPQTLLKNADIAMYSVKTEGKGSYRFFQPRFYEAIRTRLETEMELRRAIEQQQFVVHYQPRIDLAAGTTASMEALVRWQRPGCGLTGPNEFIPLAEETGLIDKLGELVIDRVCRQLSDWGRNGQHLIPVSVNVSPRQFNLSDIPEIFRQSMTRYGIDPALIEIEVTESSMMQQGISESAVFHQLRELGIRLCIDDFGTGYSSMSQLQKMHFDVLKIDRAFVLRIDCPEGDTLIASMIAMAHALGMRVVAEGVENRGQMHFLKTLGCDEGQGYFFSMPIPPTEQQPQLAKAFLPAIAPHG